jgi:hypothetical protein
LKAAMEMRKSNVPVLSLRAKCGNVFCSTMGLHGLRPRDDGNMIVIQFLRP